MRRYTTLWNMSENYRALYAGAAMAWTVKMFINFIFFVQISNVIICIC